MEKTYKLVSTILWVSQDVGVSP